MNKPRETPGAGKMKREYPDRPIVGVGVVIIDGGRVLLVKRGSPPMLGQWTIPGGVVELGETLRSAAEREAQEETGLTVHAGEVIEVIDRILTGDDGRTQFHYVLVDFLCSVVQGEANAGSDAAEVAWAAENELENFKLEKTALEVIFKAFGLAPLGEKSYPPQT
jgi:8-oxo-dGTP diphosphatase